MKRYIRPYVRGAVTSPQSTVLCVPGFPPYEVAEPLCKELLALLLGGEIHTAQVLMLRFGARAEDIHASVE